MNDKKIVFMGTPTFAVPVLEALIKNYNVVLVVSQPDKMVGRKKELKKTPVKEIALKNNVEIFQPSKIKDDYQYIIDLKPDLIVTCAYGQILPVELLDAPKFGCINVHASLLPKLRGGAPIHHAIIDGYNETGISIMYMDEKMDTGDIIAQSYTPILDSDNVEVLHETLSNIGAELLLAVLPSIFNGTNERIVQNNDEATYAYNITRDDERIDFNKTNREIFNQIRGLYPWPLANMLIDGEEFKVLEAYYEDNKKEKASFICDIRKDAFGISTNDGIIYITKIKPAGKKEMSVSDYLNGKKMEDLLNKKVN